MDHIFCEGLSSGAACPPSGATAPATPPSATLAAIPVSATCTAEPCHQAEHFATRETLNLSTSGISVADTDPNWIRIEELCRSQSVFRIRIRIHTSENRTYKIQKVQS